MCFQIPKPGTLVRTIAVMSDSKPTYAFPEKLISLQTELYEIEREIRRLPDAAVVLEDGTVFRDGEVYSDELTAKREKLWRDRTDTAAKILTHDLERRRKVFQRTDETGGS